jgi:hypothetical protein
MSKYSEVTIIYTKGGPCYTEYDSVKVNNQSNLIKEILSDSGNNVELYEIGVDSLPKGMEDIRSRLDRVPTYLYGVLEPDPIVDFMNNSGEDIIWYFGIQEHDSLVLKKEENVIWLNINN